MLRPHHARAVPGDLLALARYWEWERTIKSLLPRVITRGEIATVFQPIFHLLPGMPTCRGYEALSRFPASPTIPVGLWFQTARNMGLARDLEIAAVQACMRSLARVPEDAFVSVNSSLEAVDNVLHEVDEGLGWRLLIDLPNTSMDDPRYPSVADRIRVLGAKVCIDDIPLEQLGPLLSQMSATLPDAVKVDVLGALDDTPSSRNVLANVTETFRRIGITLIAERVERVTDLALLTAVGFEWAQGYSLGRPQEL